MAENNIVLNKRIVWIDIVKLLAILLVLIGHFIQISDPNFRKSNSFLFIYSFHMPLFMIISGYFLTWNKLTEWRDILRKRFLQLILPSFLWLLIIAFVQNLLGISKPLFQVLWFGLWFLKSLFVCILIIVMAATLIKNRILSIAVAVLISQLTVFVPHLWFLQIFTMLPCIVCGLFLKRIVNRGNIQLSVIISVNLLIFIALNVFWGGESTILPNLYPLLTSNWEEVYIVLLCKLSIGITGSIVVIGLCKLFIPQKNNKFFEKLSILGKYTMEIYILQSLILETIIKHFITIDIHDNCHLYVWILFPLLSLILIQVCVFICNIVKHLKIDWIFNFNKILNS